MEKGKIFRDLHYGDAPFIIANPWDIGTAKLLVSCGFKALATTSAGYAFSRGLPDGSAVQHVIVVHDPIAKTAILVGEPLPQAIINDAGRVQSLEDISRRVAN